MEHGTHWELTVSPNNTRQWPGPGLELRSLDPAFQMLTVRPRCLPEMCWCIIAIYSGTFFESPKSKFPVLSKQYYCHDSIDTQTPAEQFNVSFHPYLHFYSNNLYLPSWCFSYKNKVNYFDKPVLSLMAGTFKCTWRINWKLHHSRIPIQMRTSPCVYSLVYCGIAVLGGV